jgi:hypothetical protein
MKVLFITNDIIEYDKNHKKQEIIQNEGKKRTGCADALLFSVRNCRRPVIDIYFDNRLLPLVGRRYASRVNIFLYS